MLGSTVAATDAAAVFAVLRGSTLRRRIARTLEGESGVNDPIAILLVIGCIEAIKHPDFGLLDALWLAVSELAIGAAVGLAVGALGAIVLRSVTLPSAGLYPVASVAFAGIAYGGADTIHGSGFLAVFLAGLVIGSASSPARRTVITFHEGLAWVAQLALFLLLGLLVNPRELIEFIPEGTAIAVTTAVIARPLAAVLVAYGFTLPERLILGWAGLRGATPIVFATFPVTEGIAHGDDDLPGRVLRRAALDGPAGADDRARRALARRDLRRGRDPGAAGRARDAEPARRGDDAVPGPPRRRDRGPPGARARPAARGAAERDRARRPRDPAPRLDDHPGGRPAPRARPPGGRDGVPRADAPLAHRAGRPARAAAPPAALAARRSRRSGRGRTATATRSARSELSGKTVIEQLRTRRDEPGALVVLEDGRFGVSGPLLAIGPSGELQAFARRRLANASSPGRARVVAGGRRRAGALGRDEHAARHRAGAVERQHRRGDDEREAEARAATKPSRAAAYGTFAPALTRPRRRASRPRS